VLVVLPIVIFILGISCVDCHNLIDQVRADLNVNMNMNVNMNVNMKGPGKMTCVCYPGRLNQNAFQ